MAPGNTLATCYRPGFDESTAAPNAVEVTFSGETLGVNGLPFQPANDGDPVFVDGWSVTFSEVIAVVGNLRLTTDALQNPSQQVLNGSPVAQRAGPFVLDFHKPTGLTGKDGVEPAQGIFEWDARDDGSAFDTSVRYAFSYDVERAGYPATNVNLSADQFADYDLMVQHHWSKLYRGTATYVGTGVYPDAPTQSRFAALPQTVSFIAGWDDHTSALDCVNPDFNAGDDPGSDLANRGIQTNGSGPAVAQITLHVDHFFWDKVKIEGTPLRFDHLAAWAPLDGGTLDITALDHPLAATFSDGTPLPDRAPYQNVPGGYTSDQSNPAQVVLGLNGVPATDLANIADFVTFSAQSQMHLNADGLCYILGQQSGDPFFSPGLPQ